MGKQLSLAFTDGPEPIKPKREWKVKITPNCEVAPLAACQVYDAEHPEVYRLFRKLAMEMRLRGQNHYSARGIFHVMRWTHAMENPTGGGFKVSNTHSAYYARKLAAEQPAFREFFTFRSPKKGAA